VITWHAFAKLTLSLRVLGVRPDGYHELDALTVSVSEPHDELTVARVARALAVELEVSGPAAAGIGAGPDNLASRAAHAVLAHAPERARGSGVHLALRKQIPAGAGLGGGSADAAAVLIAVDRLLGLDLTVEALAAIGAGIGSDVPFCVHGGAAHMRGRGERIEPAVVPELHVVVAVPPFALSTPAVYRAWDALGGPRATREVPGPAGIGPLGNDLEPAAEHVEPRLREFREHLERLAGAPALLAGSGSACAVAFADPDAARAAGARVGADGRVPTSVVGVTRGTGVEALGPGR
jgi:4-diphosphocytidyl-2-C-methyl-D-erythritol kinase